MGFGCRAGRSGGREEERLEEPEIDDVDDPVAVEVDGGVVAEEQRLHDAEVDGIDDGVVVEVGIAEIAETVAVAVVLVGVDHRDTVVGRVCDAVGVGVGARVRLHFGEDFVIGGAVDVEVQAVVAVVKMTGVGAAVGRRAELEDGLQGAVEIEAPLHDVAIPARARLRREREPRRLGGRGDAGEATDVDVAGVAGVGVAAVGRRAVADRRRFDGRLAEAVAARQALGVETTRAVEPVPETTAAAGAVLDVEDRNVCASEDEMTVVVHVEEFEARTVGLRLAVAGIAPAEFPHRVGVRPLHQPAVGIVAAVGGGVGSRREARHQDEQCERQAALAFHRF